MAAQDDGILGIDEMLKELASFEAKMERSFALKATRAGASLYRQSLKNNLKRSTGKSKRKWKNDSEGKEGDSEDVHLYNRIGIKKGKGRNSINHRVGYVGLAKEYGHIKEYGSKYMVGDMLWTRTLRRFGRPYLTTLQKSLSKSIKDYRKSGR